MQKEFPKSNLEPNNDFLSTPQEHTPLQKEIIIKNEKQVEKTTKQQEKQNKNIKNKEERVEGFDEYYELNDYQRQTLVANNYWRIMNGEPITEVPPTDNHYHKYFDKRCCDLAKDFQRLKKMEIKENIIENVSEKSKEHEPKTEVVLVEIDEAKETININTVTHTPISIEPQEELTEERIQAVNDILAPIIDYVDDKPDKAIEEPKKKSKKSNKDEGQTNLF